MCIKFERRLLFEISLLGLPWMYVFDQTYSKNNNSEILLEF